MSVNGPSSPATSPEIGGGLTELATERHGLIPFAVQIWRKAKPITRPYLDAIGTFPGLAPFMLLSLAFIDPDEETGLFEVAKSGQPAIITPIREYDLYFGDFSDIVAWHPKHDWAYTHNGASTIGLPPASGPFAAHSSVLDWFRAGCEGVAILRW